MTTATAVYLLVTSGLLSAAVRSDGINFYSIRPPEGATPYPRSFKCFTCEQALDNYSCNRWAEDKWCPQDTQYCMTVHHFGPRGKTKFVTKRCAGLEDCSRAGCSRHGNTHHTECVSCCEGLACNVELPTNYTNAVFVRGLAFGSAAPGGGRWDYTLLISLALVALFQL
ncbi:ly6/PLAUR domain-containing protein 6B [Brachyhypopomus gauderio]|uniref:ly6/PLAUR domain-containing protein 6B n=1 Tax=Brachyhypopomus gauderio TaxID=698409 RepID=UPI004043106F